MILKGLKNQIILCVYKGLSVWLILLFCFSNTEQWLVDVLGFRFTYLPNVEEALAATGDFSIFRENTGTQTVDPNGANMNVTWDSTVSSNANLSLQSNKYDITLTDGGKYLALYNVWAEQGTNTAGTNRRALETWLTLNGTETAYGRGGGYIRDGDGDLDSYSASAAILNATAGQNLRVNIRRDDSNPTAGANIKPATNGVSVVKLKDTWDYLRLRNTATSSDISGNTAFTDVTWNTSDEVDTGSFGFTPTSGNITLKGNTGDLFLITVNVGIRVTATTNTRQNYEMTLTLGGTEIPGTRVSTYPRGNPNGNGIYSGTLVYTGVVAKTSSADQTLNVEVRRENTGAGATTVISATKTAFAAVKIPSTSEVLMIGDTTGTQQMSSSRTAFTWNQNNRVDATAFAHSTITNPSRIEIDKAGDYLFFSTTYSTTSADNRSPHRIDWRKNGTTLLNYGGHGGFNRGNTAFSAGSAGGLIMNGLTASDYIELTHIDETTNTTATAVFNANRVALQGILLNENFFGTDVTVSATGTHSSSTTLPTANFQQGGKFVITENSGSRNLNSITLTESGSIDAQNSLANIKIFYDLDTTAPYDCASESYTGGESQYGSTDTNGFSGANGVSSFTQTVALSTSQTFCGYVFYDVTASSTDGQTVQISINNPSSDVVTNSGTIGPITSVAPTGSTTVRSAELTQTHYRWLNDDGIEGVATAIEIEDTPAIGFANGTTRRLRMQVDAAGSTSSNPTNYRLEYVQNPGSCSAATGWTDVGAVGGDWDMANSTFIVDGTSATNIGTGSGGVSDPGGGASFLTINGGLRDTSSQTGSLTLNKDQFVEFEFALQPTASAPQGNSYCFRLTDQGSALRNYTTYAEGTISADITVSALGNAAVTLDVGTTTAYTGGSFAIVRSGGTRTVSSITITETGTVDAQTNIDNIKLVYDLDVSAPYDCASESYSGSETQFGSIDTNGFSSPNGTSTFSGSTETVNNTRSMCLYVVLDVANGAVNGETLQIEITDPSSDVVVNSSTVGPSSALSPTGSTTLNGPVLTQTGYHWRNDDGSESAATSASGGLENSAIIDVPKLSTRRLRLQVDNEGSVSSAAIQYRLEFGTKITTCDNVGTWNDIGTTGGAFDLVNTANLTDGSDTTDISVAGNGAITNPGGTTFLTPNGGQRDVNSQTGNITLSATQFVELEYSLQATTEAGDNTTYCFRLTNAGTPIPVYTHYAEFTTREKRDFYIQRGVATTTGNSITLTAGVDYIAPSSSSSAFVRITNSQITGAGRDTSGTTQNADDVTAYISDPENIETSFTISRPTGAIDNTIVAWEIVEFIGIAATDNEMIVRDQGTVTYGTASLFATGTAVSTVSDDSKVVVFITGQQNPNTGNAYYTMLSTAAWDATSSQPVFERGDSNGDAVNLSYAVVEFTGVNWNIQRVEHTYTVAGGAETESIAAVTSLTKAFVHSQKRVGAGETGLDDLGHNVWLSSVGAISFELQSSVVNPALHTSVAWVIENTQIGSGAMVVARSNGSLGTGTSNGCGGTQPCAEAINIGYTLNGTNNASLFITNFSTGSGTAFPRPMVSARIISTTQYEAWRSETGQTQTYQTDIVQWPVAEISFRQNYYRFYVDNDALTPSDPWPVGATDLGENTSITGIDDPLGEGERVRIRMTVLVNNATLPASTKSFKLQFAKRDTTCSAVVTWTDLGTPGSGAIWRGYDATPIDGTEVASTSLLISVADRAGSYEESNNSIVNPWGANIGEDIEYDWIVEQNGAVQRSDYCFRMINSDDSPLTSYNQYPTLRTTGYTPVIGDWRWYGDETNETPLAALALENASPVNVTNEDPIKLRVIADEVEGASGANIKFALQFSEYADFSDGGHFVSATSTCSATSTWCYFDGAGVDNQIISTSTLINTDTCILGVGNGCGTHNEAPTTTTSLTQVAGSQMEFEFTIKPAGPRVNTVYFFRLYDVSSDEALVASTSYPSLVTEGGALTFTVEGIAAGQSTEGVVTDVATTPTSIPFGSVPFDTDYEAAYRLTVDVNATEGYQMFMFANQDLLDSYGNRIEPITGSNQSPLAWSTGCGVAAVGCIGYHVGDDALSGGSTRFSPNDTYAALSTTTPEEVMFSSQPTINESSDIVFKIRVSDKQPAGLYQNDVIFISVPIF